MSTSSTDPMGSEQRISAAALYSVLVGLIPLGFLLVVVVVVLFLAELGRQVVSTAGFFVQQVVVSILIAGFIVSIIVYAVAANRTFRQIAIWQRNSLQICSRFALWAPGFTAIVVMLPMPLALLLPQHPNP